MSVCCICGNQCAIDSIWCDWHSSQQRRVSRSLSLANDIAAGIRYAVESRCDHPARNGRHEVYSSTELGWHCRACGKLLASDKPDG